MALVPNAPGLLRRISDAPRADGDGPDFAQRLAVTQFLSGEEAAEVVAEYRRFLYLAAIAAGARVPAEHVALAWRMHALHADYLRGSRPGVLGRPFPYIAQSGEGPGRHVPEAALALAPQGLCISPAGAPTRTMRLSSTSCSHCGSGRTFRRTTTSSPRRSRVLRPSAGWALQA